MKEASINIIAVVAAAVMAVIAARWAYFKILHIAKVKGLVDNPDARKLQRVPIPVMGGIVVFFGVALGLLTGYTVRGFWEASFSMALLPIFSAMVIMLYVGAMDDMLGLSPRARLVIEIMTILGLIFASGGCVDSFHGMWRIGSVTWWIAVPVTVIGGVGLINAINMVDGVNGLSSSLCVLESLLFGIIFLWSGDALNAMLAFCMAAALLPFLIRNVFGLNSRMFIGDAGTMVMGVLMTWFTICLLRSDSPIGDYGRDHNVNMLAFVVAVFCVPVFDTLRVMCMRMAKKMSPFHPDKTHLHHVFVNVGVSHLFTTLTELAILALVVVLWWVSVGLGVGLDGQFYIVMIASMMLVWGTYALINYHAKNHTKMLHRLVAFSTRTHLGRTEWWKQITARLDAPEERLLAKLEKEKAEAAPQAVVEEVPIDPEDFKEQDRKKILDFMKGRAEVLVREIVEYSGADPFRVYPILFEEEMKGRVRVVKSAGMGAPEIVTLN